MSMTVEPDSAGVRFPPPFVYLGALLLGLAAERFVTLRSFGIDWRVLVAPGGRLFVARAGGGVSAGRGGPPAGGQPSPAAAHQPHPSHRAPSAGRPAPR